MMGLGNGLRLTWVGHATWIMETPGGKRVLIDPWVTGNPVVPDELKDTGPFDRPRKDTVPWPPSSSP